MIRHFVFNCLCVCVFVFFKKNLIAGYQSASKVTEVQLEMKFGRASENDFWASTS